MRICNTKFRSIGFFWYKYVMRRVLKELEQDFPDKTYRVRWEIVEIKK
jgi:hypothetical protein